MSICLRRPHTSASAALTALALSISFLPAPAAAAAALAGKGSVLTLEGDDAAKAAALTKALQSEFAARGVGGGREMSLSELKLTMGCDEPPAPKCLADGGKTLGVDTLVYGSLTKSQGGFVLTLSMLDVASVNVQKTITEEVPLGSLEAGQVQATAKGLVAKVLGPEKQAEPEPTKTEPEPEPTEPEPAPASSRLVWGKQDNVPGWKKAGLGVSAALTVASFGAAIGLWMTWRRPNGSAYNKLTDLAKATYDKDADPDTQVPYWMGQNICENARNVGNDTVTAQCSKNEGLATATTGLLVAGGIFAVSTIAFTTLLFVRREKSSGMAKLQKHGVSFGAAPTTTGFVLGGAARF